MKFLTLALILGFSSCTKKLEQTPEAALQEFVDLRVGKVINRDFILEKVTGQMLQSFKQMPAEEFAKFADMKNIQSDSFKILAKTCAGPKCQLTYTVGYTTKAEDRALSSSEVKKVAELVQSDDKWLISVVKNVQTVHTILEPLQ